METLNESVLSRIRTPAYVIDERRLEENLRILADVRSRTGCRILLALKAFAVSSLFPVIRRYLDGVAASSLNEARLGCEEFGKETHLCAPAYSEDEFPDLLRCSDHIVFNSFSQWERFRHAVSEPGGTIECGIRINHGHSEVKVSLYDPCARHSRLGVTAEEFRPAELDGITGLHFHSLCELNSDALDRTLKAVDGKFGPYLRGMSWVNLGGGHHITRADYDRELLCRLIDGVRGRYDVRVYIEPGEAVALNCGALVASVLDITHNETDIAILDTSASAHMPDVLEMPYRPRIKGAGTPGEYAHTYILGGSTCLAGDVIGQYSFPNRLSVGDKLCFGDMAHYTIVKNTTFNGVRLPAILLYDAERDNVRVLREFGYEDYRTRMG